MISQIFTQDCFKVMVLFSLSPGSRFNRTEIKSKVKLNNVPLDKALLSLLASEAVKREKNYYSVNLESEYAKKILELCNKQYKQLRELPLDVFYLLMDLIFCFSLVKGTELFLFGSYAKLIYKEGSDVDLAVLSRYQNSLEKKKIDKIINKLEKNYHKKVELHHFERKSFYKNKRDPLVKGILRDGIRLI